MSSSGSIKFGTRTIDYNVTYSDRRKNLAIAVHPDKRVEVVAPADLDHGDIQEILKEKARWVVEKIEWFDQIDRLETAKEYVNGETFLYMGRQYRLKILRGGEGPAAKLRGGRFEVSVPPTVPGPEERGLAKDALWQWYLDHAEKKVSEVVRDYAKRLHIDPPPRFKVKYQEKRWGSCPRDDVLHINIRIIMAPMSQIEYVVAHELCHLRYKDHSAEFWQLLRLIMPDYEVRKENLRKEGWRYVL